MPLAQPKVSFSIGRLATLLTSLLSRAGQGMNVSMMDTWNLSWKLAYVIKGLMGPKILATCESVATTPFARADAPSQTNLNDDRSLRSSSTLTTNSAGSFPESPSRLSLLWVARHWVRLKPLLIFECTLQDGVSADEFRAVWKASGKWTSGTVSGIARFYALGQ